mmetsp:Transcript_29339/g.53708  ORF Transcript_29339/g.53708 Transcript_29339/m.53708 type:complete len:114 (+) Transcript_29339:152-493(+)
MCSSSLLFCGGLPWEDVKIHKAPVSCSTGNNSQMPDFMKAKVAGNWIGTFRGIDVSTTCVKDATQDKNEHSSVANDGIEPIRHECTQPTNGDVQGHGHPLGDLVKHSSRSRHS